MADIWDSIPTRSNANVESVDASWWNVIKTYLKLAFPGLSVSTSPFTIANNQSSYQNITGFVLDKDTFTRYKWRYRIQRSDDTPDVRDELGTVIARWDGTAWVYTRSIDEGNALGDGNEGGDYGTNYYHVDGATGQVQYKTSNMTGSSYEGTHEYRIIEVWNA